MSVVYDEHSHTSRLKKKEKIQLENNQEKENDFSQWTERRGKTKVDISARTYANPSSVLKKKGKKRKKKNLWMWILTEQKKY